MPFHTTIVTICLLVQFVVGNTLITCKHVQWNEKDNDDAALVSTGLLTSLMYYDSDNLPKYACLYCGIYDPACVSQCVESRKCLSNATYPGGGGSHLVNHLVRSGFHQVQLHPESPLGDTVF